MQQANPDPDKANHQTYRKAKYKFPFSSFTIFSKLVFKSLVCVQC